MTLHLIQPRELYGPPERQEELSVAWCLNDAFFDLVTVPDGRPSFTQMFALCRPDAINVIANSDIHMDHTLRDNAHRLDEREVWALSRYEDMGTTLLPYAAGAGVLYLVGALALGLPFLWMAWQLWRGDTSRPWAAITFHYSLAYLALLFVVVAVDAAL
jgi:hypothetical protein